MSGFPERLAGVAVIGAVVISSGLAEAAVFRPPAVPLVTHDPYFSVWSPADRLTDAWTVHWTGKRHALSCLATIDGTPYRLAGPEPQDVPPLPQTSLRVDATRTTYVFQSEAVELTLTFDSPLLPQDLEVMSRPVTYVTFQAASRDGAPHAVKVYLDVAAEWAVNTPDQPVTWSRPNIAGLVVLRTGAARQRILARKGDDLRIEWGYLYLAAPATQNGQATAAAPAATRRAFATGEALPGPVAAASPLPASEAPVLALAFDLGQVGGTAAGGPATRSVYAMVAYDDEYSIRYFGTRLRPYWRRNGATAGDLLQAAARDYESLIGRCQSFNAELREDLTRAGGSQYADIATLAYRQSLAANKIVADAAGQPLMFSKENFSNGCIATVDVLYPAAPQLLLTSPALLKASLAPILDYAMSPRWKFPFAPHDLGTYPFAEGQVYGGGETGEENQMPVEESGNMLLLMAALVQIEGNADFAEPYWPVLSRWAEYLAGKGFDPERQLCTDDFAGHLAHNVNLSAKAILALGAYSQLADRLGKTEVAATFRKTAEEFAARWIRKADDGDHYRLVFDKPQTWSQKYNLIWNRILGLGLFPEDVVRKEMSFYRKVLNRYGLPLDNRETYTKTDWTLWTASLTGSRQDFEALVAPVWDFLCATPDRVPMTDWYRTTNARLVGFRARSVVGGVFIRMLDDPAIWKKWAGRAARVSGPWAPIPTPPEVRPVIAASDGQQAAQWRHTFEKPPADWYAVDFNDSGWKQGPAGFGARGTPGARVRTVWNTPDIWARREFTLPEGALGELRLLIHHDEDAEVYINGLPAATLWGYTTEYEVVEMNPEARGALKPGVNILAVHCHQTGGGQYIDVGIVEVKK